MGAFFQGVAAPGPEHAPAGRVQGAGDVAGQDDPLLAQLRVRFGQGRHEGPGVGMLGVEIEAHLVGKLHHPAQVHHRHPVRDVLDHGQVVGDEEHGQIELDPEFVQQVEHLGLDGDVQGANRLVGHDELRGYGQGPGDADALPLAAGEFVGVAVRVGVGKTHRLQQLAPPPPQPAWVRSPVCARSAVRPQSRPRSAGD